jgi:protein-S-isoprenylcysteine O-methyltransferase Ste14
VNVLQPWNIVFVVGFVVYVGIRHEFGRRTKDNETVVSRLDAMEKVLLVIAGMGSLSLPILYLCTPWFAFADYRLPAFAPWCGSALMVASLWLFWRSHADLGLNWSVSLEVRRDHQLVRDGVYRLIRHPMYASIWLWSISQALLLQNWLAGFSALVTFALLYFRRIQREEQMMCEFIGDDYREYMQRTGRVFPRSR